MLSPEEEYAISGGLHGDPQAEGYDAMEAEVFRGARCEEGSREEAGPRGIGPDAKAAIVRAVAAFAVVVPMHDGA